MYEELMEQVYQANLALSAHELVTLTWGNASGIDRQNGTVAIKPSGVPYSALRQEDIVLLDLETGKVLYGSARPSSDASTHLELYRRFTHIGGIVHTHSRWATVFAQAGKGIPPLGTTHADDFFGEVPCSRSLSDSEITGNYEKHTGSLIAETLGGKDPAEIPAVLVACHGPFCWGKDAREAVHNAVVLEEIAFLAFHTLALSPQAAAISPPLLEKHFLRKHGEGAYYGQP